MREFHGQVARPAAEIHDRGLARPAACLELGYHVPGHPPIEAPEDRSEEVGVGPRLRRGEAVDSGVQPPRGRPYSAPATLGEDGQGQDHEHSGEQPAATPIFAPPGARPGLRAALDAIRPVPGTPPQSHGRYLFILSTKSCALVPGPTRIRGSPKRFGHVSGLLPPWITAVSMPGHFDRAEITAGLVRPIGYENDLGHSPMARAITAEAPKVSVTSRSAGMYSMSSCDMEWLPISSPSAASLWSSLTVNRSGRSIREAIMKKVATKPSRCRIGNA